jgi:hypothetical protein
MKGLFSPRALFISGFLILIVSNIVVLSGVAVNRSGTPETLITLTERELRLPYRVYEENSGLTLRLDWRTLSRNDTNSYNHWESAVWFGAEKLKELGFNIDNYPRSKDNKSSYRQPIPKEVFIVLENNGALYREAVRRTNIVLEKERRKFNLDKDDKSLLSNVEQAEKRLKREHITASRLFAIDAGLNPQKLREKYHDQTRFIITKGLVKPGYRYHKEEKEVYGHITRLSIEKIHVPLKHRKIFDAILAQDKSPGNEFRPPRYEVELAYGRRFEPWIVSVQPLDD